MDGFRGVAVPDRALAGPALATQTVPTPAGPTAAVPTAARSTASVTTAAVPDAGRPMSRDELVRAAFDATAALVLVVDAGGRAILVNDALLHATGWTEAELTGRPFWDTLVAPEDVAGAQDHVRRGIEEGAVFPQEGDWLDRAGGRRRVSTQNSLIRDADGLPVAIVTVGMDVTDQRRAEADLRERAATDLLTGLRNRAALFEALGDALTGPDAPGCGLLFADLDGFKAANDSYGHHVGDLVLVEVATRLRRVTGMHDVVARLGGDEFVVLCPGGDLARLTALAERVEAELVRPVDGPQGPVHVGVSIGTALAPRGTDADEAVRAADRQMYRVKQAHRLASAARTGERPVHSRPEVDAGSVVPLRGARFPRSRDRG